MGKLKKVTVNLPEDVLANAQRLTGKGHHVDAPRGVGGAGATDSAVGAAPASRRRALRAEPRQDEAVILVDTSAWIDFFRDRRSRSRRSSIGRSTMTTPRSAAPWITGASPGVVDGRSREGPPFARWVSPAAAARGALGGGRRSRLPVGGAARRRGQDARPADRGRRRSRTTCRCSRGGSDFKQIRDRAASPACACRRDLDLGKNAVVSASPSGDVVTQSLSTCASRKT